ncbi:MAG: HesA/MoeB/ThiF family protein [Candidatus Lokiarchaeota archaeon]|nr:HesA/MoeB/ThiF family protein [Candidatus Harpocratesius repetitus]
MISSELLERYQRQILVIGKEKQELLASKTVVQVGLGGLGSPLALYLTASGIGKLIIFEKDELSLSNLGRQILYRTEEVNQSKGEIGKKHLESLNPFVSIQIIEKWFDEESAIAIFEKEHVDYIVDASDNFQTKFLVNDLGIRFNIPFTIAGIQGFEGQLLSVIPKKTACYRCLFGHPPEKIESKPIPVMAPTCGVVGSLEASEVIKSLLNIGDRITDRLMMISLDAGEFSSIPFRKNPDCFCQKEE